MALQSKLAKATGGAPVAKARPSLFAMARIQAVNFHQKNTRPLSPRQSTFVDASRLKMAFCATEHTSRSEQRVKVIRARPDKVFNELVLWILSISFWN
jgi:hypothetical protein